MAWRELCLVLLIFGLANKDELRFAAVAVASYDRRRLLVHLQHALRQPAVAIGLGFPDTFACVKPSCLLGFVGMELIGGIVAWPWSP
jgi:hypothetical protein